MDFFLSNFSKQGAKAFGKLYYEGSCVKAYQNHLSVSQSARWQCFGNFAEDIATADITQAILSDDFYFRAEYSAEKQILQMQTDIVGYEAAYYYLQQNVFACSDDLLYLVEALQTKGIDISLNEENVREYLYFTESLFNRTLYTDIKRLPAASIITLDCSSFQFTAQVYDDFKMTGELSTAESCAQSTYHTIDDYFSRHQAPDTNYAIGLSGGLDSRVGAYFAQKYQYNLHPIFIGRHKGPLGLRTFDCKRAEDIASALDLKKITYFDPRQVPIENRIAFSALHAPGVGDGTPYSIGILPEFDVLINGMMGGEAYGSLIQNEMANASAKKLTDILTNMVVTRPRYRTCSKFSRRLGRFVPVFSKLVQNSENDPTVADEIISQHQLAAIKEEVTAWVTAQQKLGLDGINIAQKFFYYTYASTSKFWYYASFSNGVPSMSVYMNPSFIRQMLKWDPNLLPGKPIQKSFISKLGDLAQLRSQTIEPSISTTSSYLRSVAYAAERVLRGGAMVYTDWFTCRQLRALVRQYVEPTKICSTIRLTQKRWFYNDHTALFSLIKASYLETYFNSKNV